MESQRDNYAVQIDAEADEANKLAQVISTSYPDDTVMMGLAGKLATAGADLLDLVGDLNDLAEDNPEREKRIATIGRRRWEIRMSVMIDILRAQDTYLNKANLFRAPLEGAACGTPETKSETGEGGWNGKTLYNSCSSRRE